MPSTAILFPGQGSHTAEMAAETAALRPDLLAHVVEVVGEDPFPRAAESTAFAQPAILCAALARFSQLAPTLDGPVVALGHSLGELGALVAAGQLDELDALALAAERGRLMAAAGTGGMVAVLGGTIEQATELADSFGLTVANDNAPGQVVLAGSEADTKAAARGARGVGLRALRLDVTGAFHSPAMAAARDGFEAALHAATFTDVPVGSAAFSPTTVAPVTDPVAVLSQALTSPVRFREAVLALHEAGVRRWIETGPGDVLAKLVGRILDAPDVRVHTVREAADVA
ncbi:ACP S-malonyltransferase [Paraconexibacter algicola]|uniref:[acyl-carrier-protein] S-malonyltransferase n=1 Tax=Paraconexibacter algicola TaxID=2133960 RepID=A0A2T4UBW8_9ACTN|nr:ACP S-malonyltransferase [Paraconexibacter algicola]PTL54371.1 malonyl CoA-acyl carrier protein transacylase [Paraconexibacter algicola]